jgi:hypothetical protein
MAAGRTQYRGGGPCGKGEDNMGLRKREKGVEKEVVGGPSLSQQTRTPYMCHDP